MSSAYKEGAGADVDDVVRDQNIVLFQVRDELDRQLAKWGIQSLTLVEWIAVKNEEFGEAGMEANKGHFGSRHLDEYAPGPDRQAAIDDIRGHYDAFEKEMIEVAAVAIASVESIRRQRERLVPR